MVEFRKPALDKREEPDDLAVAVRLTPPRSWIALVVLASVVGGGVLWGFLGRVGSSVGAPGALSVLRGSFGVPAPEAGQVMRLGVRPGDVVQPGATVAELAVADRVVPVRTATGGLVATVRVQEGGFVSAGAVVAVVQRVGQPTDRLVAVLYLPARQPALVVPGAPVDIAVDSLPSSEFGMLRGTVTAVDPVPEGREQIGEFLGDPDMAAALAAGGPVRRVVVDFLHDRTTPSGYSWTRGQGPPTPIPPRLGIQGVIHLAAARPIDWIRP